MEAVVKAAESRTTVTSLLNQIKEMVDADAFTCLTQDTGLLGDEQAANRVISVIRKAFDQIDGTLELEDVKYIARQAKKHGDEEDILNYVLRRHGVKVLWEGISTASPYDLQPTHSQMLSNNKMTALIEDIKVHGIQEPIKYVKYNGEKYVVDGHHRLLAAKRLGLAEVPIERVKLPYAGYNSIDDLLWFD